jgi:hypothetical protein
MKDERIKIGTITSGTRGFESSIHFLKISSFIGRLPINEDYIKNGEAIRAFKTRGEAVDYAIDKLHCDHVVIVNSKDNSHFRIRAHIGENPFFKAPPLVYTLAC